MYRYVSSQYIFSMGGAVHILQIKDNALIGQAVNLLQLKSLISEFTQETHSPGNPQIDGKDI